MSQTNLRIGLLLAVAFSTCLVSAQSLSRPLALQLGDGPRLAAGIVNRNC